jgi:uncharacterized surface protein with fasciclin (FAS1) repeats
MRQLSSPALLLTTCCCLLPAVPTVKSVFAPTNSALSGGVSGTLSRVINYHIVPGMPLLMGDNLPTGSRVTRLSGVSLSFMSPR